MNEPIRASWYRASVRCYLSFHDDSFMVVYLEPAYCLDDAMRIVSNLDGCRVCRLTALSDSVRYDAWEWFDKSFSR